MATGGCGVIFRRLENGPNTSPNYRVLATLQTAVEWDGATLKTRVEWGGTEHTSVPWAKDKTLLTKSMKERILVSGV